MKTFIKLLLFIFFIGIGSSLFAAQDTCGTSTTISAGTTTGIIDDATNPNDYYIFSPGVAGTLTVDLTVSDKILTDIGSSCDASDIGTLNHNNSGTSSLGPIVVDGSDIYFHLAENGKDPVYSLVITFTPNLNFTCANPKAFTSLYSEDNYQRVVQIGNTSLCETDGSGGCSDPGSSTNNNIDMVNYDYDDVLGSTDNGTTLLNSSGAVLDIPVGKTILWAGLFWQGYMVNWTDAQKEAGKSIKYKHANDGSYTSVTNAEMNWVYFDSSRFYYQSYINMTSYVQSQGAGTYWVGDIATTEGQPAGGSFGAWSMVVVYQDSAEAFKNTTVFHGYQAFASATDIANAISYASDNSCSTSNTGVGTSVSSTLTGFMTPNSGDVNSTLLVFAGEGDIGLTGDSGSITDSTDTEHAITNALNPANNIMNATISNNGTTVTTGLPYISSNSLGADIDSYTLTNILDNAQTSTKITLTSSGDGYMPGMYALETQLFEPGFCYDYSYQQNGISFTEDNDGTQDPKIFGDISSASPIDVKIFLRNLVDSDIPVTDMYVDVLDINTTQASYVSNSTQLAKIGDLTPVALADGADVTVGTSTGGDYLKNISIGSIDSEEHFYLYYQIDPSSTEIDMPIKLEARYNLTIDGTQIPYDLELSNDIPLCAAGGASYSPSKGIFNVVHNNYYDYNNGGSNRYYNLPTQVTSREGNFKVVAMDPTNLDEPTGVTTSVYVELIDAAGFHDIYSSCQELESSISEKVLVLFENNATEAQFTKAAIEAAIAVPRTDLTSSSEFYKKAQQSAAFRISYTYADTSGDLVGLETMPGSPTKYNVTNFTTIIDINDGVCATDIDGNLDNVDTIPQNCSNSGGSYGSAMTEAELAVCMKCIYGLQTKMICSRDNFAIRPEAFMMHIDDQNQTNQISQTDITLSSYSGTSTASAPVINLAAGYDYNIEVNATNHVNNTSSDGYTTNLSSTAGYKWLPRTGVTAGACNDENNKSIDSTNVAITVGFYNGSADQNTSVAQVGEYTLNMTDTSWTQVDSDSTYMAHHTGTYFTNTLDCTLNSSATQSVNVNALNGCNISSNHTNNEASLAYNDYDVTLHPYYFNLTGITPTVGLNHTAVDANSYIYMADMNVSQDENMSYHLNGNIRALGENNSTLSNFVDGCFAKPLDINISKSDTTLNDSFGNPVVYQLRFHDINSTNDIIVALDIDANDTTPLLDFRVQTTQSYFQKDLNGVMDTYLNLNYNREVNTSVNPNTISFIEYKVNCTTAANCTFNADLINNQETNGTKDLNSSIALKHYYGRTNAPRQSYVAPIGTAGNAANDLIYYEVYCDGCTKSLLQTELQSSGALNSVSNDDPRWFVNTNHTSDFGVAEEETTINQKGAANVSGTGQTGNHQDSTNLVYNASRGYPYKATMENNASGWLIYNKYDATDTTNEFQVEFLGGTGAWAGEKEDNTNTTTTTGSTKTNRRSTW